MTATTAITEGLISYLARLATLTITLDESHLYQTQLTSIFDYIDRLKEIDTTGVLELSSVTDSNTIVREDIMRESLSQADALSNIPHTRDGSFVVPAVFSQD